MNLRHLECFLAVAEELHFRRAAESLHLSPASVSDAVAGLERSLGGRLVERTSRRVSLTPLGVEFAASIRTPIAELRHAHRAARLRAVTHRDVIVAHTPELGQLLLPRLLSGRVQGLAEDDLASLPPWRPIVMHTPEQLVAVAAGEVDVGLCWSVPDQPSIASEVLGEFPMVAVLRASDELARHTKVSLTQVRERHILITPRTDNPYLASQFEADMTRTGIPRAQIEEVARYDELVVHVASRGHVGLHPGPIALTTTMPGVVFRPVVDAADSVRICAIRSPIALAQFSAGIIEALRRVVSSLDLALDPT